MDDPAGEGDPPFEVVGVLERGRLNLVAEEPLLEPVEHRLGSLQRFLERIEGPEHDAAEHCAMSGPVCRAGGD